MLYPFNKSEIIHNLVRKVHIDVLPVNRDAENSLNQFEKHCLEYGISTGKDILNLCRQINYIGRWTSAIVAGTGTYV